MSDYLVNIQTLLESNSWNNLVIFNKTDLLGDIFQLRLLTTGRELITLNEEKNLINKQSIVVANPNFNLFGKNSSNSRKKLSPKNLNEQKRSFDQKNRLWGSLPGTKKEADIISKITNAKLFLEDEASALNIQKTATGPRPSHTH